MDVSTMAMHETVEGCDTEIFNVRSAFAPSSEEGMFVTEYEPERDRIASSVHCRGSPKSNGRPRAGPSKSSMVRGPSGANSGPSPSVPSPPSMPPPAFTSSTVQPPGKRVSQHPSAVSKKKYARAGCWFQEGGYDRLLVHVSKAAMDSCHVHDAHGMSGAAADIVVAAVVPVADESVIPAPAVVVVALVVVVVVVVVVVPLHHLSQHSPSVLNR
mmetsp:Transcript_21488/g.45923  ORF Transcript_21488/g.45923 Transcript_21488/m.45923 type:complete len:214 (+) Transcript_21488:544-1185(+)